MENALVANRSFSQDLLKSKHHCDQLAEQFENTLKEKRKLIEEIEIVNNQLTEIQTRCGDVERKYKFAESERFELQSQLDDLRDSVQMDAAKYNALLLLSTWRLPS